MAKLVKMIRETPEYEGGPVTADVCEAALADFLSSGWKKKEGNTANNTEEKAKEAVEEKPVEAKVTKAEPAVEEKSTRSPRGRR